MQVFSISRDYRFSASHVIATLPEGHKCTRLHGHSYQVRVEILGALDERGMVIDYGDLDWISDLIAENLDHRHLNDVMDDVPTAELVARWLWQRIEPGLSDSAATLGGVGVSESPSTWAWLRDNGR